MDYLELTKKTGLTASGAVGAETAPASEGEEEFGAVPVPV